MKAAIAHLTFGVELEVVFPTSHSDSAVRLRQLTDLPIELGSRRITNANLRDWRIVHDGSVRGDGFGGELVSPILKGPEGLAQVAKLCRALVTIGATVNQSCGFHVHVGVAGADLAFFKNLVKLYAKFESVIDGLMPPSRRGGTNVYCASLSRANARAIDSATSFAQVVEAQTGISAASYNVHSQRYFKLNLAAFNKHSTVEFRQHAGTTDGKKATAWVKTCLRMVIAARSGKDGGGSKFPISFDHLSPKARRVAEMVTRPNGATRDEILSGSGFGTINVGKQATIAGIQIRVVRIAGQPDRFYAVADDNVPMDLGTFVGLIESSIEEREFLARRAAELSR